MVMVIVDDYQKKARRRLDIRPTNIEDEIYKDCYVVEMFNAGTVLSSDSDRQGRIAPTGRGSSSK